MHRTLLRAACPSALALVLFACSEAPLGPSLPEEAAQYSTAAAVPQVVISQVYGGGGNSGATLKNDFVELFNPGTEPVSLAGWSVQYASATGVSWQVTPLTGTIQPGGYFLVQQAAGSGGTVVLPTPDATGSISMGASAGKVALSRTATALSGTCPVGVVDQVNFGTTATNCGAGTTPAPSNTNAAIRNDRGCAYTGSLAVDFTAAAPAPRNSASPTTTCDFTPPPPPPPGDAAKIVVHELMTDPLQAESASWGEWFEVYNADTVEVNLQGWTLVSAGQAPHVVRSAVVIPAGGYAVLGRGGDVNRNGGVTLDYNYFTGTSSTIWLDDADWLVLRNPNGVTADSVAWTGSSYGATRALRDAGQDNADGNGANWGYSTTPFGAGDLGTPGAANGTLSSTAPAVPTGVARITFSGRNNGPNDAPLPVGFADQLFATALDLGGNVVATTFTWATTTPELASVDQNGVVTAKGAGTATITATSADGRVGTYQVPTRVGVASATAVYGGNTEFGEPADGDASDDFIVRRDQFTSSYNVNRGTPNWVSYAIDPTHFGPEDRCDCFTPDPELPADYPRISTADYTSSGTYHGYGIDRGHLARSFDRTAGSLDNATTFYFTNIIPQAADNNQGPWAALEDSLGKLARNHGREVYVIAGVSGSLGTLKGEGKVVIPARTWKVAVIMPGGEGLADVATPADVEVIAVDMPNQAGIRGTPWHTYKTTVDAIEAASGYDLLAKLPDAVERITESNDRPPVAAVDGPYTGTEGTAVHMSAAGSTDPDGDALTYAWDFGDGTTGTGAAPAHAYADNGNYVVKVTVTDPYGAESTATTSVMVVNVAPTVAAFAGETLLRGETFASAGTFADAGTADSWTATVDYGDGSGAKPLALAGSAFSLSHAYNTAGTFTVTVRVTDDDGDTGTRTATVVVQTAAQGAQGILSTVEALVGNGTLTRGEGSALSATLDAAKTSIERDRPSAANQLNAFINQVQALQGSGRISAETAQQLIAAANRVIRSIGG
ncbi:MAG: DNA/RNA non-specific endonuclease [Gemmatimonadota bacterium]